MQSASDSVCIAVGSLDYVRAFRPCKILLPSVFAGPKTGSGQKFSLSLVYLHVEVGQDAHGVPSLELSGS